MSRNFSVGSRPENGGTYAMRGSEPAFSHSRNTDQPPDGMAYMVCGE
jgi:hypothetical protein